jgi:hypothetical protein
MGARHGLRQRHHELPQRLRGREGPALRQRARGSVQGAVRPRAGHELQLRDVHRALADERARSPRSTPA